MNILVVGGGGREHALAWKASQSPKVSHVYVAPGNAGTAMEHRVSNVDISADDIDSLVAFAADNAVELTIIGPEAPLVAGIVDRFTATGLKCFGPSAAASQLEGSKRFSKDFLARHNIPTADYAAFDESDTEQAIAYVQKHGAPIVIKADGLAAGKGVIVAMTNDEAIAAVRHLIVGGSIVIEEFLDGEEASFIVIADGTHIVPMASSQDHKARDEGDKGPNTGGMGAYSPAPVVTDAMHQRIMREVIEPTIAGMAAEGHPYTGFLYAGVMIGSDGAPKVLEFNCRFGDPEPQPIMMRLRSDLSELCLAALDKRLDQVNAEWDPRTALGVVLAAGGYPNDYAKGLLIHGLDHSETENTKIFHAGTTNKDGDTLTSGGRVLCACALGDTPREAQALAYQAADQISWDGMFCRRDIGYRAIERENPCSKGQS